MAWMGTERAAFVETLRATDPEDPTLCDGWSARYLLAHLVQREHRLLHSAVDMVMTKTSGQERFMGRLADSARSPEGYAALVDRFAGGPPGWSPMRWAGDAANLVEYVVHHEDVRRAGTEPAEPRTLPAEELTAIWKRLTLMAKLGYRRSPVGVVLATPAGRHQIARKGDGEGDVVITGEPVELALHALGRREAAQVEFTGPPEALRQFESWAS